MSTLDLEKKKLSADEIVILGIPFDENSSFRRGSALAPQRIREALLSESSNLWTEKAVDLGEMLGRMFLDDLVFLNRKMVFERIENDIYQLLKKNLRIISLGGDHSITYPIISAYGKCYGKLNILHLDAHPDLYDEFDGNRHSHACPFARIMEKKLVQRLVQIGVRTVTDHQREQAERFGVEIIQMKDLNSASEVIFDGPVYLSLDMDCLDPAFAPGVSHREPGGMSTREVLSIIQELKGNLVGADIVEYNPERDFQDVTGMVAGKLLKELLGKMVE